MSKEDKKTKAKKTEDKPKATKTKTTKAKPATKKTEAKPKAEAKAETKPKLKPKAENTIFVGSKPAMTYVLAIMTCFNESKSNEVRICARGRAISTAVDVAELTRNRFLQDLKVKSITTSTEQVIRREGGGEANVSAIEIVLSK
ncbi:MAG: DNA-binding protein Alba [Asgard group archaeon]|nr:DNA-binding protein Alba [Asgard group archaeon]